MQGWSPKADGNENVEGDGIRDNCDNCVDGPNGPLLGTCLTGPSAGNLCHSELECVGGGCSLSQDDADENFVGDACEVPEPGFGILIGSGTLLLAILRRTRAQAGQPSGVSTKEK